MRDELADVRARELLVEGEAEVGELERHVDAQPLGRDAVEDLGVRESTTARVSASFSTPSPSSVVFASSPSSLSRRRTTTASSSVSPATNRAAPSRMPCRRTTRCSRGLSAAARIAFLSMRATLTR